MRLRLLLSGIFVLLCFTWGFTSPALAKYSFAVFGDNRDGDPVFKKLIRSLNADPEIQFAVSLGDIVSSGLSSQYQHYLTMIEASKAKIIHCIGNHEIKNGGYPRFEKYFGRPYYDWEYQTEYFIKLDNVSQYGLGKAQETWLFAQLTDPALQEKSHLFVFMHKPMYDVTGHMPHYVMGPASLVKKLHQTFREKKVRYVFAGHTHGYGKETFDGIHYIISGGAGSPLYLPAMSGGFYHYIKVTVDGETVTDEVVKIEPPYE